MGHDGSDVLVGQKSHAKEGKGHEVNIDQYVNTSAFSILCVGSGKLWTEICKYFCRLPHTISIAWS